MPLSYSGDLRCRVMIYVAKEGSQRQLTQIFKLSLSFVKKSSASGIVKVITYNDILQQDVMLNHLTIRS